jgi:hypothetical protein
MDEHTDRRQADIRLDAHVESINGRLDVIDEHHRETDSWHAHHITDYHANLKAGEAAVLIAKVRSIPESMVDDIALSVELLAGKEIIDEFTKQPTGQRHPGIAKRVEVLEYAANGGRGLSIRTRDKLLIIVANAVSVAVVAWLAVNI